MRVGHVVVMLLLLAGCEQNGDWKGGLPAPGVSLPQGYQMPNGEEESNDAPSQPLETPTVERSEHNAKNEEPKQEPRKPEKTQNQNVPKAGNASQSVNTQASVHFLSPLLPVSPNPVSLRVTTEGPIAYVRYQVYGQWGNNIWNLGESHDSAGNYPVTALLTVGGIRTFRAQALNGAHVVIAETSASLWVQVESASSTGPDANNPASSGSDTNSGSGTGNDQTPASNCPAGQIMDCDKACAKAAWINDGTCDDGTNGKPDFTCPALGMDGTDCGLQNQSNCEPGELIDCNGSCAKAAWVNDGVCDDGSQYSTVFTCPELGNDGTDCATDSEPAPATPTIPTPTPQPTTVSSTNVPYFYQYANTLHPGSSCQNTSIAMLLAHYGWGGKPDDITQEWGKNYAQSPSGLAAVFNSYAKGMGIPQRLVPHTNGTLGAFRALLQSGKPTIVHAYMTQYGHVVLATGYDGQSYTVNDPAGQWNQQFKGGYPYGWNSTKGKGIQYGKAAFDLAISSLSGSDYAPLWYHEIVN